ncbi:MAG TPA: hypothetical protein VF765_08640, partial [Polyangiaceae bacterium]
MKSPRSLARAFLSFTPLAASALVAACATNASPPIDKTASSDESLATHTFVSRRGLMPPPPSRSAKRAPLAHAPTDSYPGTYGCTTPLVYYGGPIISKPNVVQVSWNLPTSTVDSGVETYLSSWWPAILSPQTNY